MATLRTWLLVCTVVSAALLPLGCKRGDSPPTPPGEGDRQANQATGNNAGQPEPADGTGSAVTVPPVDRAQFISAVADGKLEDVRVALDRRPDLAGVTDADGRAPLHLAAMIGNDKMVALLLDRYGADLQARDKFGNTPLMVAADHGAVGAIGVLADHGADLNARDKGEFTALHNAAGRGHEEAVRHLVKHGADVNAVTARGQTPLHIAAIDRQSATAQTLLSAGAKTGLKDADGLTPMDIAKANNDQEMITTLGAGNEPE